MTLPRFLLGHNSLIGVNHVDRGAGGKKLGLTEQDRTFLAAAADLGVEGIVLDPHPVAVEAANFLKQHSHAMRVVPMIPYAQGVVDAASRGGIGSIVKEMLKTSARAGPKQLGLTMADVLTGQLATGGARMAIAHELRSFDAGRPPVVFLHNAVTDMLLGWDGREALEAFAKACRSRGSLPGFVTLNPGAIPTLGDIAGEDAWFMAAVNSRGIQMSPSREAAERVLQQERYNVVAMSVLGGGVLKADVEIPRAFKFPAVKSVVIGTTKVHHLETAFALATGETVK